MVSHLIYFLVLIGYSYANRSSLMTTHLSQILRPRLSSHFPLLIVGDRSMVRSSLASSDVFSLTSPLVKLNLSQFITTSQPEARHVLSSVLGSCCTSAAFCDELFVGRCIEMCYESNEGPSFTTCRMGCVFHNWMFPHIDLSVITVHQ